MKYAPLCTIFVIFVNEFVDAMYNGEYRSVKDYPFMAQLYYEYKGGSFNGCGAAILSEYWVVTAAHCVGKKNLIKNQVRVGSSLTFESGIVIDMEKIFVYSDYDPGFAWDNDIALVKLKNPIAYNEYQQPIQISKETPKVGDNITVVGVGDHHHSVDGYSLRAGQTSIVEDKDCIEDYNKKYTKNMICTSAKHLDLCYGDSGGPAVHNNKLIGVIAQGCEYTKKHTKPNILTKVASYYEWILQTTGIKYID